MQVEVSQRFAKHTACQMEEEEVFMGGSNGSVRGASLERNCQRQMTVKKIQLAIVTRFSEACKPSLPTLRAFLKDRFDYS